MQRKGGAAYWKVTVMGPSAAVGVVGLGAWALFACGARDGAGGGVGDVATRVVD